MYFVSGAEEQPKTQNVEGKRDIARGGGDDAGGRTMMTWRRSARPTVAISVRTIGRLKTKPSSNRSFSCKQRGRPSGGTVAGTMLHAAAPPGA
jgi:hypothetical protein